LSSRGGSRYIDHVEVIGDVKRVERLRAELRAEEAARSEQLRAVRVRIQEVSEEREAAQRARWAARRQGS